MRRAFVAAIMLLVVLVLSSTAYPIEEPASTAPEPVTPPPITAPAPLASSASPPVEDGPEETEPPTPEPVSRYAEIEVTDADVETLARLVWLEARGEPFEGQRAVVEVVLNRILSPSFPDTTEAVVYQRNQFSPAAYIAGTTPTEAQYEAVAAAIEGIDPVTDADVVYFSVGAYNERIFATIGNHIFCRE